MKVYFLTLFPSSLSQYFVKGMIEKGLSRDIFSVEFIDLRDFSEDKHNRVDDYPYGGKQGMLLKADVLYRAITSIDQYQDYRLLYPSPKGPVFNHDMAQDYATAAGIIFICGYYEGVDARIFDLLPIERVSIGDFVLLSGESPSLMMAEATLRLLPGLLGNAACVEEESIISGRLEHPQYTAPRSLETGDSVPEVLLSGHHEQIGLWRKKTSLADTLYNKPSLFIRQPASLDEQSLLLEILKEA